MLNRINAVSRHGYTWQTALGNMGLNDMNGRIEDAVLGRFLSADLYVSDAMSTQSYNRYSYVNNNPLTYTDPSGFCLVSFGGGEPYDDGQDCPGVDVSAARSHTDGSQGYHCGDWDCVSQITQLLGRNLLDFPIIAVPGSGGDGLEEVKVTAKKIPWKQCGPHSLLIHGIGLSGGANAEAGAGLAGAAAQVSAGGGAFHNSNGGWSRGSYTTYGAAANALNAVAGTPAQSSTPVVAGASFGGGASVFVTNAQSVQQLTGPFTSYSLNVGVGPAQFSAQLSVGGGIWQFGVSPPYAGETLGLSVSKITTNTVSSSTGGCQ
jgi:RHS repeat-associated protein